MLTLKCIILKVFNLGVFMALITELEFTFNVNHSLDQQLDVSEW